MLQCWIVQFFSQSPRLKINFSLRFSPSHGTGTPFLDRISPRTCARRQMRWQKNTPMPWQNHTFSGPRPFLAPYALAKKHLRGRAGFFPPTIVLAKKHLRRRASFSRVTPKAGRKKSSAGEKTPSPHWSMDCSSHISPATIAEYIRFRFLRCKNNVTAQEINSPRGPNSPAITVRISLKSPVRIFYGTQT